MWALAVDTRSCTCGHTQLHMCAHAVARVCTRSYACGHTQLHMWTHAVTHVDTRRYTCGHTQIHMCAHAGTHVTHAVTHVTHADTHVTHADTHVDTRRYTCGHTQFHMWTHAVAHVCTRTGAKGRSRQRHLRSLNKAIAINLPKVVKELEIDLDSNIEGLDMYMFIKNVACKYAELGPHGPLHITRRFSCEMAVNSVFSAMPAAGLPYQGDVGDAVEHVLPVLEACFKMPPTRPSTGSTAWVMDTCALICSSIFTFAHVYYVI